MCVIGGGAAGITVASSLSSYGRVLTTEAGNLDYTSASQELYQGTVTGDPYFALDETRLRFFGGSTNHWGGMCRYLEEHDFEAKEADPNTAWPISKSALDPFAVRAREILELQPFKPDLAIANGAFSQIQFQYNPVRFAEKFLSIFEKNDSEQHLLLNANCVGLELEGRDIKSAIFENYDGKRINVRAKAFVLACGGIENSRLLLYFNRKLANAVGNQHDLVGRHWMEHPTFSVGETVLFDNHPFDFDWHREDLPQWFDAEDVAFFALPQKTSDDQRILNCGFRISGQPYQDTKKLVADLLCVAPGLAKKISRWLNSGLVCGGKLEAAWEQQPSYRRSISLDDRMDRFGIPKTRLDYRLSELDRSTITKGALKVAQIFAEQDFGRIRMEDWILDEEQVMPDFGELAGHHHMGGTRMASTPKEGVVDSNCLVFGTQNLFIAGSSVFPSGGHANPTFSIVQLSLRLADHLRQKFLSDQSVRLKDESS